MRLSITERFLGVILFLACCTIHASHNESLEQAVFNSDFEGVRLALLTTSLTTLDQVGLLDLANDVILQRLKAVEWNHFRPELGDQGTSGTGSVLGAFGLVGIVGDIPYLIQAYMASKNRLLTTAVGITSVAAFMIGMVCQAAEEQKKKKEVCATLDKLYHDALKIKKLIHEQHCID